MTDNIKTWEDVHAARVWGAYPPEDLVRFVARQYGARSKEERRAVTFLDLGCGQGASTWFLAREGFEVTAIDASNSAVQKTRERMQAEGLAARIEAADFRRLEFPPESFDCIIDIESIYTNTAQDINALYQTVYRLLKPGGMFFTMSFSTKCSNFGTGIKVEEGTYIDIPAGSPKTGMAHYFERNELKALLQATGFKDIEINEKSVTDNGGKELVSQWIAYGKK